MLKRCAYLFCTGFYSFNVRLFCGGKRTGCLLLVMLALFVMSPGVPLYADYLDDVGYSDLVNELGDDAPDGTGVIVAQIEARSDDDYMPDTSSTEFDGKTFVNITGLSDGVTSHATNVAKYFYGNDQSMAGGITDIHVYAAAYWLYLDYLMMYYTYQPIYDADGPVVLSSPARVMNHSWVGSTDSINAGVLRKVDFVAAADQSIQVAAVNNSSTQYAMVSSAYNAITVGRTDGSHATGTVSVDDLYDTGRTCPLLVSPTSPTSYAAPVVAAACALLVETGEDEDIVMLTDPVATAVTDRSGNTIRTSSSSAIIKAALLAGARRVTQNTTDADIVDYRSDADNQTDSGLDARYGAGQVNIYSSYHILTGGEFNSLEDDAEGEGLIDSFGFDVDPSFGGENDSNSEACYYFTAGEEDRRLYASLVWHLAVDGGTLVSWDGTAELYDLDLFLYDITNTDAPVLVAGSEGRVENTENLWTPLVPGRSYLLKVAVAEDQENFDWDYALAWRMTTPPDSDSDGIPDDYEVQFGLDFTDSGDASEDSDGDGLDNEEEYIAGTDISLSDTDGDGVSDGVEVSSGSDPLDVTSLPASTPVPAAGWIYLWTSFGFLLCIGKKY